MQIPVGLCEINGAEGGKDPFRMPFEKNTRSSYLTKYYGETALWQKTGSYGWLALKPFQLAQMYDTAFLTPVLNSTLFVMEGCAESLSCGK